MIKKTLTTASMLILSAALIWAVWEGNAAVGDQGDFPSGLFASSDLFPKYTLIEITNLEQNTTSRAVIIDSRETQGMLVKVSTDLAKALAIKEGTTVRVRVSVPPLVAEEGADPVLLGKVEEKQVVPTAAPAKPAKEKSQSIPVEEPVQTETEGQASPIAEVEEAAKPETVPEKPTSPVAEVSEPVLPEPEIVPLPAAVSEVAEPIEVSASSEYFQEAEEPVPDAPPIQETPVQEGSESSDEYTKPVLQAAEIAVPDADQALNDFSAPVPEVSTPIEPEPVIADKAEPEKDSEDPASEPELLAAEPNEELMDDTQELQDEPEVIIAEETPAQKESEDGAAEDEVITENHVMLVPSEPREPVREYIPAPQETEKSPLSIAAVTQPAEEVYTANVLAKGSFYVQVGRFKDILNVESFVQLYGKQYPIAVEKSSMTKEVVYKVYVGPLKKDERGATLETFQKLGFKDAFLKKAP
jgi:acidic repeat protein